VRGLFLRGCCRWDAVEQRCKRFEANVGLVRSQKLDVFKGLFACIDVDLFLYLAHCGIGFGYGKEKVTQSSISIALHPHGICILGVCLTSRMRIPNGIHFPSIHANPNHFST
jgi:hypothetical protein